MPGTSDLGLVSLNALWLQESKAPPKEQEGVPIIVRPLQY
jgi:hypothetical protein